MKDYWKNAPDSEVDTGKNILRYFKDAGRLQVCMPNWTDKDGEQKQGKTVTLNLEALRETPEAVQLLETVLADIAE